MDSAMSYWGPDAAGRWQEGPIALGARQLPIACGGVVDAQPLIEPDLVLAGRLRFDGRTELGRALDIAAADLEAVHR